MDSSNNLPKIISKYYDKFIERYEENLRNTTNPKYYKDRFDEYIRIIHLIAHNCG